MRTKLYDYQVDTANDIFLKMNTTEQRGAYLGFDTGTGKTVTSLSVAEQLYKNHMIKGVVVICPVSKIDDWKKDIAEEVPDIEMQFVSSFQSAWREKNKAKIEYMDERYNPEVIQKKLSRQVDDATGGQASKLKEDFKKKNKK